MFTFNADFAPGEMVTIRALERSATVQLIRVDESATVDYFVAWWEEGKRMTEWLPRWELEPRC